MALASIAGISDEGAVRVTDPELSGGKGRDGLMEIKTAYDPVSRDDQVTENFSLLMAELGACSHVRTELQNAKYSALDSFLEKEIRIGNETYSAEQKY